MRSIEISTEVFALIWAARQDGEETEDQILRRILQRKKKMISDVQSPVAPERKRADVRWRDDIVEGLERLGGEADLHEIYRIVKDIRQKGGRSLPPSVEAVIRRELENNSSDSESFTGHRNLFRSVNGIGGGRWALR
jgi:predicted CopG family antitoxin